MARSRLLYSFPRIFYRLKADSISFYLLFSSLLVHMYCSIKQVVIFFIYREWGRRPLSGSNSMEAAFE